MNKQNKYEIKSLKENEYVYEGRPVVGLSVYAFLGIYLFASIALHFSAYIPASEQYSLGTGLILWGVFMQWLSWLILTGGFKRNYIIEFGAVLAVQSLLYSMSPFLYFCPLCVVTIILYKKNS